MTSHDSSIMRIASTNKLRIYTTEEKMRKLLDKVEGMTYNKNPNAMTWEWPIDEENANLFKILAILGYENTLLDPELDINRVEQGERVMFVITGTTGCYEDTVEWMVAIYSDEDAAQAEVLRLREEVKSYNELATTDMFKYDRVARSKWKVKCDPGFQIDSTGTYYDYRAVPFRG